MGLNFEEFRKWLSTIGNDLDGEDVKAISKIVGDCITMDGNW